MGAAAPPFAAPAPQAPFAVSWNPRLDCWGLVVTEGRHFGLFTPAARHYAFRCVHGAPLILLLPLPTCMRFLGTLLNSRGPEDLHPSTTPLHAGHYLLRRKNLWEGVQLRRPYLMRFMPSGPFLL
jgi:hypothetical protein